MGALSCSGSRSLARGIPLFPCGAKRFALFFVLLYESAVEWSSTLAPKQNFKTSSSVRCGVTRACGSNPAVKIGAPPLPWLLSLPPPPNRSRGQARILDVRPCLPDPTPSTHQGQAPPPPPMNSRRSIKRRSAAPNAWLVCNRCVYLHPINCLRNFCPAPSLFVTQIRSHTAGNPVHHWQ